jgi:hypothetical protein
LRKFFGEEIPFCEFYCGFDGFNENGELDESSDFNPK